MCCCTECHCIHVTHSYIGHLVSSKCLIIINQNCCKHSYLCLQDMLLGEELKNLCACSSRTCCQAVVHSGRIFLHGYSSSTSVTTEDIGLHHSSSSSWGIPNSLCISLWIEWKLSDKSCSWAFWLTSSLRCLLKCSDRQ